MRDLSDGAFRALADQTRRDILRLLRSGPRTSGQIAARFESSWPTISRHLSVLREAGLVSTERRGQEIYYELNTSVFQDVLYYLMQWTKGSAEQDQARARKMRRVVRRKEV